MRKAKLNMQAMEQIFGKEALAAMELDSERLWRWMDLKYPKVARDWKNKSIVECAPCFKLWKEAEDEFPDHCPECEVKGMLVSAAMKEWDALPASVRSEF